MGGSSAIPSVLSFAMLLGCWAGFLLLGLGLHELGRRSVMRTLQDF